MDRQSCIVRLNNGIRNLGRGNHGEGGHHSVGKFLADLGNQQRTHAGTSATSERVGDLETLEAVASLSFATNNIEHLINQLGTLSVMALGPVVSSPGLTEDEVVWSEKLTKGTCADSIHGTWLKIDKNCTWDIFIARCLGDVSLCWSGLSLPLHSTSLK
jgi:hypothetical protein